MFSCALTTGFGLDNIRGLSVHSLAIFLNLFKSGSYLLVKERTEQPEAFENR